MKIQAGPLITIIAGFVIVAAGYFWHLQTARIDKTASRAVAPSSMSGTAAVQPSPKPEVQPPPQMNVQPPPQQEAQPSPKKEETAGATVAAREPASKPTTDATTPSKPTQDAAREAVARPAPDSTTPTKPTQDVAPPSSPGPVAERSSPAQVGSPDAALKASALAFAIKIRAFELTFDARREQIFDKKVGDQAARQEQMQELKAIDREKANEFTQTFLPQAQQMEGELLRRLQARGINAAVPPPPRGISMALGRSLLQLSATDVALPGHRPVQGLAAYLEFLAGNLPD